jgi:L,D-transpeptidase-like protein
VSDNEIHFYPGARKMAVFTVRSGQQVALFVIPAVGGPPTAGTDERMPEEPTKAGRFVIGKPHAYRTPTWLFSQIPWGTKLRDMRAKNDVWFQQRNGAWASIKENYKIARDEIMQEAYRLYGRLQVPNSWVFNDFGPIAIRYFEDKNNNRKLDGQETLSGQMIHTTSDDEAATALGLDFELGDSHGCVHIRPEDRIRLMSAGVFKVGAPFVVHSYSDVFPATAAH